MATEHWQPSQEDKESGADAYIRYAGGVAILNNPEALTSVHAYEVKKDNLDDIIVAAEQLMIAGLTNIIRYAHPEKHRSRLSMLEKHYDEALPHMRSTLDYTFRTRSENLRSLNPAFEILRPMPLLHKRALYNYICHGRLHLVQTWQLMDGFQPSELLRDRLRDRKVDRNVRALAS